MAFLPATLLLVGSAPLWVALGVVALFIGLCLWLFRLLAPSRLATLSTLTRRARTGADGLQQRADRAVAELGDDGVMTGVPTQVAAQVQRLVQRAARHDPRLAGHHQRVAALVQLLASDLGMDEDERTRTRVAALIHDIGWLRVDRGDLAEVNPYDDSAATVMRSHLGGLDELSPEVIDWLGPQVSVISEHHERWDGTGVPGRRSGEAISLGARLLAVVEAFDVATSTFAAGTTSASDGTLAGPVDPASAMGLVGGLAGSALDPKLVRVFLERTGAGAATEGARSKARVGLVAVGAVAALIGAVWVVGGLLGGTDGSDGNRLHLGRGSRVVIRPDGGRPEGHKTTTTIKRNTTTTLTGSSTTLPGGVLAGSTTGGASPGGATTTTLAGGTSGSGTNSGSGGGVPTTPDPGTTGGGTGGGGDTGGLSSAGSGGGTTGGGTTGVIVTGGSTSVGSTSGGSTSGGSTSGGSTGGTAGGTTGAVVVTHPPVATDDSGQTREQTEVRVNVTANDSDPDGDLNTGSLALTSNPAGGSAGVSGGQVVYRPAAGFIGTDSFGYRVCDQAGQCASARVSIVVDAMPVVATDDKLSVVPGTKGTVMVFVLNNDKGFLVDSSLQVVSNPAKGVAGVAGSAIRYEQRVALAAGETDSFAYRVCGTSGECATATVLITGK